MDSLNNILLRKDFDEPSESVAIKGYIARHFDATVSVTISAQSIIITANSAALANTLRLHTPQLKAAANNTDKKILFRIG